MQLRILLAGLSLAPVLTFAQQKSDNSLRPREEFRDAPATQTKKSKKRFFSPGRANQSVFKKQNVKHTARYEFYERVEQAAREKQRILKKLSKRAYSDLRYFGHKRMPKKRAAHKMRFCSECGIRH